MSVRAGIILRLLTLLFCGTAAPGCFTMSAWDIDYDYRSPRRVGLGGSQDDVVVEYSGPSGHDVVYREFHGTSGALHGRLLDDVPTTQVTEASWPTPRLRRLAMAASDQPARPAPPAGVRWLNVRQITWQESRTDGMHCFIETDLPPATQPRTGDMVETLDLELPPVSTSATLVVVPDQPPNERRRRRAVATALTPLAVAADVVTFPVQAVWVLINLPFARH